MRSAWLATALACVFPACQSTTKQASSPHVDWSYEGATGPAHWGDLSPDYSLAKSGKRQSPIDIATSGVKRADAAALQVRYGDTSLEVLNNGHTIEDDYHAGGTLTVDGHTYQLAQFHFHSPSEHSVDGEHAPMEMHLVHKDSAGKLAVIGVLIREGRAHPELAELWEYMPTSPGRSDAVPGVSVDASELLPANLASYRYSGSLTTPPCSEDVAWFVLQEPIEASAAQIAAFREIIEGNNRPTQPLNGRVVTATE